MTRTAPELAHPSPNIRTTPAGRHLAIMYDVQRAPYKAELQWISVSNLESSGHEGNQLNGNRAYLWIPSTVYCCAIKQIPNQFYEYELNSYL
ncbi:hypothetical protein AVEN_60326-1 [Araneus ventricosus]|uniref:Uncharacterized protein n=1 Tax=Araneus ventricosus TaxID=182803 RepID=A0A4Y2MAQ8_ARAVE|nr:hypothetical protein AVEN_60326-1 [Araneus ventricosus]